MKKRRLLFIKLQLYPAPVIIENAIQKVLEQRKDIIVKTVNLKALESHFSEHALKNRVQYAYFAGLIPKICEDENIDAVFFLEGFWLNVHPTLLILKKMGIKTIGWMTEDPYEVTAKAAIVPYLDYIFTVDSAAINFYQSINQKAIVKVLPLGSIPCPPAEKRAISGRTNSWDISLIGVPHPHSYRVQVVDAITHYLSTKNAKIAGAINPLFWMKSLSQPQLIKSMIEDRWIPLEEVTYFYIHSKINIVVHRDSVNKSLNGDISEGNESNLTAQSPCERIFNIAAVGGFQIVDNSRPELNCYFEPQKEIIVFDDPADLIDKCEYYLTHSEERKKIALAGQKRALQYSYDFQLNRMLDTVKSAW